MKQIITTIGFVLFSFIFVNGQDKMFPDSMYIEVLLNEDMMQSVDMYPDLNSSIGLTAGNDILLSSPNQFYLLRWGEIEPTGAYYDDPISSFSYTPEGFLLIIQGNKLCYIKDTLGTLETLYTLPNEFMTVKRGKEDIYLFDSYNKENNKYGLYVIAKGLKYMKLLDFPEPIEDVEELNGKLLLAAGNKLFSIDINSKEITSLASIPDYKTILSVAVNTENNAIYLSTYNEVYSLKDNNLVKLFDSIGGKLVYLHHSLLVFYPGNYSIVRIVNFDQNSVEDNKRQIEREYNLRQRIRNR